MAKFYGSLIKWGNSVGINLPRPIRESLKLEAGADKVEIIDEQDRIIIKKISSSR
jgi:antitoxin component of MazEF toxin-antitoxin module